MPHSEINNTIIFCNCSDSEIVSNEKKIEINAILKNINTDIIHISDLCGLAAHHKAELKKVFGVSTNFKLIACFPRVIKWLFQIAEISLNDKNVDILNARTLTVDEIKDTIQQKEFNSQKHSFSIIEKKEEWVPWFPVIDYDRCNNCKQCSSFCLFGVYEISENGKVTVKNPENCKTNCPACARVCPEAAIMFPKHDESPINGDEITDEEMIRKKVKLNVEEMLGDDVYEALAERRRKAKKIQLRKKMIDQATNERIKYTKK